MTTFRTGQGYDVHRLVDGRPLILGGVAIPSDKGALGHSDADVLLHAITNALLGAAALGDIGTHFPDDDPAWKDIDSSVLLKRAYMLVSEAGYAVGNIDSTVILQSPKISSFIPAIRENIARMLDVETEKISVKATTTEGLGFPGRGEGIAAMAVVTIFRD